MSENLYAITEKELKDLIENANINSLMTVIDYLKVLVKRYPDDVKLKTLVDMAEKRIEMNR